MLGGAKPPEEATLGPGAPGSGEPAGEIWYNPIPEEDPRLPAPELPGPQPGSAEAESPASPGEHKLPTLGPVGDYKHNHPHPKPRILDPEVCCPHRRSPCQPPDQSLPHQIPRPGQAPLNEDEEAA